MKSKDVRHDGAASEEAPTSAGEPAAAPGAVAGVLAGGGKRGAGRQGSAPAGTSLPSGAAEATTGQPAPDGAGLIGAPAAGASPAVLGVLAPAQEQRAETEPAPAPGSSGGVSATARAGTARAEKEAAAAASPVGSPAVAETAGTGTSAERPTGAGTDASGHGRPGTAQVQARQTQQKAQTAEKGAAEGRAGTATPGRTATGEAGGGRQETGAEGPAAAGADGAAEGRTEAAAAGPGAGPGSPSVDDTRRISRPMAAGAALLGILLLASPFAIKGMTGHSGSTDGKRGTAAAFQGHDGSAGFVPSAQSPSPQATATVGHRAPGSTSSPAAGSRAQGPSPQAATVKHAAPSSTSSPAAGSSASSAHAGSGTSNTGSSSQPSQKPPATYSAVGGPYCSSNSSTGFQRHGKYTDGQKGWTTHVGQFTGSGCDGHYVSIPMSGSSSSDYSSWVVYTFSTGAVHSGTCTVSVYVPDDHNVLHVGGHPSYYTVYDAIGASGSSIGHFKVAQTSHLGSWVSGGTYRVTDGRLSIKLHDRGIDYTSGYEEAHHAAAAIKVSCTA
jgi:translation initiation factor IF-2